MNPGEAAGDLTRLTILKISINFPVLMSHEPWTLSCSIGDQVRIGYTPGSSQNPWQTVMSGLFIIYLIVKKKRKI